MIIIKLNEIKNVQKHEYNNVLKLMKYTINLFTPMSFYT